MKDTVSSFDKCLEVASQYNSLTEWQTGNPHSYAVARRNDWHRDIGQELGWNMGRYRYWTYEKCLDAACEFGSITEWQLHHGTSYNAAYRHDWVQDIARRMGWRVRKTKPKGYWTYERLMESAGKCGHPKDWAKTDYSAYVAAGVLGLRKKLYKELGWSLGKKNVKRAVNG